MDEGLVLLWLPLVTVLVFEHILLTRGYRKQSSLQRLWINGKSARADCLVWFIFYVAWPYIQSVVNFLTIPGLIYVGMVKLVGSLGWPSLFGAWMPSNPVMIFIIWLFALDFAIYVSHVLMHKVPWFWHFHRLHHSATEFNVITGIRISIAETFFNDIVILILLSLILGLPSPKIVLLVMFVYAIIDLLQHSDLPWDYGIVGYVIASPRYHRMHHSMHAEDSDTNYGNIFSFWDYWFGTVADRYRHSSTIADGCSLGLRDEIETEKINDGWYLAPFQATGVYYAISLLRHTEKIQEKSERFGVQVNTKLVGGD